MTAAEVRERVRAGGLLSSGHGVVAMLSGGRDSVCLLDVAVALCGAEQVHALHVNYGLRGRTGKGRPQATCMRGRVSCAMRRRVSWHSGWTSAATRRTAGFWLVRLLLRWLPPRSSTWRGTVSQNTMARARAGGIALFRL
jgi:hypothetical protein